MIYSWLAESLPHPLVLSGMGPSGDEGLKAASYYGQELKVPFLSCFGGGRD